jgi:hypothetical protein
MGLFAGALLDSNLDVFHKILDHLCRLRAGGLARGDQQIAGISDEDAMLRSP